MQSAKELNRAAFSAWLDSRQRILRENREIEVTSEMIEAGADAILGEVGGADLGGLFSADELAAKVYRAMVEAKR